MKNIFENLSGYGAKWGCYDFYEENEEALRQAIAKGQAFTTDWYGVAKESASCNIEFDGATTTVQVSVAVDEAPDLADTLVWRSCGGNTFAGSGYEALEKTFPGADPDAIMEEVVEAILDGYEEYTQECKQVERLLSYDELLELIREAEMLAYSAQNEMATSLESVVANYLACIKEDAATAA